MLSTRFDFDITLISVFDCCDLFFWPLWPLILFEGFYFVVVLGTVVSSVDISWQVSDYLVYQFVIQNIGYCLCIVGSVHCDLSYYLICTSISSIMEEECIDNFLWVALMTHELLGLNTAVIFISPKFGSPGFDLGESVLTSSNYLAWSRSIK